MPNAERFENAIFVIILNFPFLRVNKLYLQNELKIIYVKNEFKDAIIEYKDNRQNLFVESIFILSC